MVESYNLAKDFPYIEKLPNSLFQANREKFIQNLNQKVGQDKIAKNGIALFRGVSEVPIYNSDCNYPIHQEGSFYYLFGVCEPDCYGVIELTNNGKPVLFVPRLSNMYRVWMTVLTKEDFHKKYEIETYYIDEFKDYLERVQLEQVYLNAGVNSDSDMPTQLPDEKLTEGQTLDKTTIYPILADTRVTKTDQEIDVMRWATSITVEGHIEFLRKCKVGMRESQIESIFKAYCEQKYACGRMQPYTSICGCGHSAATLHYNDNDQYLKDGQTMLVDQAHSVHHYASDITSSFPVNGKFTQKQREIYEIVLKASQTVMSHLKPGVNWIDMHLLAERVILTGLSELGLVTGDIDEMINGRVGYIFMPHGLGHLIGLDVHDVGAYLEGITPPRRTGPGLRNCRTARDMEQNLIITVEPGLYFRDFLLDGEFGDDLHIDLKYLNREKIREYQQEISGVRIEDVVLITDSGCENLSQGLPRSCEEIERCMKGEDKWRTV
eukprot:403368429